LATREPDVGFRSKDGNHATNAIEIVAVDDNANVVSLAFRWGTGQDAGGWSEINFSNSDASLNFMTMDGVTGDITVYQPTTFATEFVSVVNKAGPGILIINGQALAELAFQHLGENKWFFQTASDLIFLSSVQPVIMVDDGENLEPVDIKGEFVQARKWNEFKNGGDERGLASLRARLEAETSRTTA
jgi:hypothetical protein